MKKLLLAVPLLMLFSFVLTDKLTGRWVSRPSVKGNVTTVIFGEDNTFEGFVNGKAFASGTYSLNGELFSFVDNGCDGMRGTYKLDFFSKGDSLRLVHVNDSCEQRRQGISALIFGRAK